MLTRNKILFAVAGFLASVCSSAVFALSLGDISVNSRLDEPLNASIELHEFDGLIQADISVTMGTQADFDLVDLERRPVVDQMQFDVQLASGTLQLTTTGDIALPYLSFILNVSWPSGRLIREYTVLLDVPTFTDGAPALRPSAPEIGGEYTIQLDDTLWEIALKARGDNTISVQQMMIAIQASNAEAFIDGNINRIRTGEVLRLPSRQEALSLSQQQAMAQVAIQNQQLSIASPQPLSSTSSRAGVSRAAQGDELSVLTGADGDSSNAGNSTLADLDAELALSEESLDRARLENEELNSRLSDLQSEIEILQNIIAIEDERVAQLQVELIEQAELTAAALVDAQEAADNALAAIDSEPVDSSLMGKLNALFENSVVLIATLWILVALVISFLIWRSRKAGEDDSDDFDPAIAPVSEDEEEGDVEDQSEEDAYIEDDEEEIEDDESLFVSDDDINDFDESPEYINDFDLTEEVEDDDVEVTQNVEQAIDFSMDEYIGEAEPESTQEVPDDSLENDLDAISEPEEILEDKPEAYDFDEISTEAEAESTIEFDTDEAVVEIENVESFEFSIDESSEKESAAPEIEVQDNELEVLDFDVSSNEAVDIKDEADDVDDFLDFGNLEIDESGLTDEVDTSVQDDDEDILEAITDDKNESSTKLDLAVAYEAMGDLAGAREILNEVLAEGDESQVTEASKLMDEWKDS